ncbi:MAG: hypothetical protein HW396_870 [Candidatus Dadabacteria bacterium]|nr:hypothetical protein [Candidatus Dadabacteria bacterium]
MKKEGQKENSLISEELRNESKKPAATGDEFNWNTLNIGKQEDKFNIDKILVREINLLKKLTR